VKLHVFASNLNLLNSPLFISESGEETLSLTLKNATARHWIAEIEGISDRTQAEQLRGTCLYIDDDVLPAPDDGEFYIADLIGLKAVTPEGKEVGEIIAVKNFGAGDLLEIRPSANESFYLPFTHDTVPDMVPDIERDQITVIIPEGLLE